MMEVQRTSSQEEGREDYTEILQHLAQRIYFIDAQGQEREFAQFPLLIGRGNDCGWVIPNKNISRHHAEVIFSLEAYSIQDLKSLNGVRVNGFKVDRVVLEDGDQISLGELRFTFHLRKLGDPRSQYQTFSHAVNNDKAEAFSPSLEEAISPANQSQHQSLQKDKLDLDLEDFYTPEAELNAEISEILDQPVEKKWWPALLAVLAAATVAASLVGVAYYFLQPQLMGGGLIDGEQKESAPVIQQQVVPQKIPEAPVLINQNQTAVSATPIQNMQSNPGAEWNLEPAAQSPLVASDKLSAAQQQSVSIASSVEKMPLPQLAVVSLDLPESVRSKLSQENKINRAVEKKIVSPVVVSPVNSAQTNKYLSTNLQKLYIAGDEAQLVAALDQLVKKVEVAGEKSRELLTLHQTVSRLLALYHQADKSYQAGNKTQSFALWSQFLNEEKSWLGSPRSAYSQKVMQSVMNEYLVRAQAASAAGNQVLAAQYREKSAALSSRVNPSLPRMEKTAITPASRDIEKTMATASIPAYSSADAEALYQKGLRLEYSNLEQAIILWRQVTQSAPTDSDVYAKASAKLAWYDKWKTTTQ